MPYKSEAQRKFFNSPAGKEKLGEEEVEKWNKESKGQKNLPKKVSSKDTWNRAIKMCDQIEFPSENEAIEYCKENGIDPHKIALIGDKYVIK